MVRMGMRTATTPATNLVAQRKAGEADEARRTDPGVVQGFAAIVPAVGMQKCRVALSVHHRGIRMDTELAMRLQAIPKRSWDFGSP